MTDVNLKSAERAMEQSGEAVSTATQGFQAFAAECAEMSRQSLEHATETLEKLRQARSPSDMMAIQTHYLRECFENFTQHSRRFAELLTSMPMELGKSYADLWTKNVSSASDAARAVGEQAASNVEKLTRTP